MALDRVKTQAFLASILILLTAQPALGADPDNCLFCHKYAGLSRFDREEGRVRVFHVDPNYSLKKLGPHSRLKCTDCHDREEVGVIPHLPTTTVDCTRQCHLVNPHGKSRRFSHENVSSMLEQSVHTPDILRDLEFTGGPLLGKDQSFCLYCHDEPIFRDPSGMNPGIADTGAWSSDRCDVCHQVQVPAEIDYYFRHIASRLQPARPTLESTQICAICHSDPAVRAKHGLRESVASYMRSFHGKAALLGDQRTASCVSCHIATDSNVHLMLSANDRASSVHPLNVGDSCRSTVCHPGADRGLGRAGVHLDLPSAQGTAEFALAVAFILLTALTFLPSLLLVLLELFRLVIGRRHDEGGQIRRKIDRLNQDPIGRRLLQRFTVFQRVQHWTLAVLFILLALTGFPMKFAAKDWAKTLIDAFGGLGPARAIHHWCGIALIVGLALHVFYMIWIIRKRQIAARVEGRQLGFVIALITNPIWISLNDLKKTLHLLAYLVGLRSQRPAFGRFSIRDKFEYIGVFWGTVLLGATGIILWGEQLSSHLVSGRLLNLALIAHTYEAFLAVIHVGILHICNVMLAPSVFPISLATVTGQTPTDELAESHSEFVDEVASRLEEEARKPEHE